MSNPVTSCWSLYRLCGHGPNKHPPTGRMKEMKFNIKLARQSSGTTI